MVIVWAVVGLLPFFKFPPSDAMLQRMVVGWPGVTIAGLQVTGSATAVEVAVTPVIVS